MPTNENAAPASEPTLAPCPFCGGKPYATRTVNGEQMYKVGCAACGIEFKAAWYRGDEKPTRDIDAAWNRRSPAPASGAPGEEELWGEWPCDEITDDLLEKIVLHSAHVRPDVIRALVAEATTLRTRLAAAERAGVALREIARLFAVPLGRDVVADLRAVRDRMLADSQCVAGFRDRIARLPRGEPELQVAAGTSTSAHAAFAVMVPDPAGHWVRYSDVLAALTPTAPSPEERANG